jgi:hypothetical protein
MNASAKSCALRLADRLLEAGGQLLGKTRAARLCARLAEKLPRQIAVETKYGILQFYCPSETSLWRAETLLTKEPETIEWIETFNEESVFWDVGANIGVYSLYAAARLNTKL